MIENRDVGSCMVSLGLITLMALGLVGAFKLHVLAGVAAIALLLMLAGVVILEGSS